MIKIKSIYWLDEASYEGEITLVDSLNNQLVCFTDTIPIEHIESHLQVLSVISDSDFIISSVKEYWLRNLGGFDYEIIGKVIDKDKLLVQCFEYIFSLDGPLPGDIVDGDWIEFKVSRVDIVEKL